MNSKLRLVATVSLAVLGAGILLNGPVAALASVGGPREFEVGVRAEKRPGAGAIGRGGWRVLAADLAWIQLQGAWERRDQSRSEALIRTAVRLDPHTAFFWRNGARMIAFDFPVWRIAAAGGAQSMPAGEQRRIRREHASRALAFLEEMLKDQPACAPLWLERAGIELHGRDDFAAAAASYGRAWQLDPTLTFAARLHVALLRRTDRLEESLAGLRRLRQGAAATSDPAEQAQVAGRIRDLEREIAASAGKSSQPVR